MPYRTSVADTPPAGSYEECVTNNASKPEQCDGLLDELLPDPKQHHMFRGCVGEPCPSGLGASDPFEINERGHTSAIIDGDGEDHHDSLTKKLTWLRCWGHFASGGKREHFDIGVGVTGGRGESGGEPHLGTVGVICQPYAKIEWSMNWDFLDGRFRPAPDALEHNLNETKTFPQYRRLRNALVNWYQKLGSQDYLTQLPMQLCAPGYVLRGLEVEQGRKYIRGITAVHCVRSDVPPRDAECLKSGSSYPCRIPTHVATMHGDPKRDISQHIGAPNPSGSTKDLLCEKGEYVSGLVVSRDVTKPTSQVSLSCADL